MKNDEIKNTLATEIIKEQKIKINIYKIITMISVTTTMILLIILLLNRG